MITRSFNLYLNAGHSVPLVINVNQYDSGEQWVFTLYNADGTQYTPSTGAIVGIKSDGLGIINSGSVVDGKVVINETQQMTAAVGKAVFELLIDSQTHGTANFVVLVEEKPGNNADLSESDISMIEQAIEAASTIKPYGSPLVASTVAGMTDHDKVYVYVGSETGYTSGNWYYWDGSAWTSGGVYNSAAVQTDTTLTLSGVAADAKKTGDEISDLKNAIAQGGSFTAEVKAALLAMFRKCLLLDGGDDAYDALESALYPPANLVSISAVYTQSGTVYTIDSLDSLKSDLVVTAHYSDSTTETVTNYALSGTLTAGTSAITVAYGGKTTTFSVTVTLYEKYSYSLTNEDLIKFVGSVGWTAETGLTLNTGASSKNARRAFVLDYGVQQLKVSPDNTTFTDSGYYPIPVPSDATSVTVAITPSSQFFGISGYTLSEGFYTRVLDDGWKQGSRTVTFAAGTYDYITIGSKYNSSGTSYPTEPSELTITFE